MLQTLARIATQLETDGHISLADEVDEIITSLAAREPFERYNEGDIWAAELDEAEPSVEEEIEESGLVTREPHEVGLGFSGDNTYSSILEDFKEPFMRWLHKLPAVVDFGQSGKAAVLASDWLIDTIMDEIYHVLEQLSARGAKKVKWDEAFPETARRLIRAVLEQVATPAA